MIDIKRERKKDDGRIRNRRGSDDALYALQPGAGGWPGLGLPGPGLALQGSYRVVWIGVGLVGYAIDCMERTEM